VEDSPAKAGSLFIETRDRPRRTRARVVIVEVSVAVVRGALEPAVELARLAAPRVRNDVVDVAAVDGHVATGRVLALPVPDLDGAAYGAGEGATAETDSTVDGPSNRIVSSSAVPSHAPN
jgi:hypothetical protein